MTRDAARKMFRALERAAGVQSVAGRGWNGVRRVATDLAEDCEKDERVLNSITGHRDSRTRRSVYQAKDRPTVLQKAAEVPAAIRAGGANNTRNSGPSVP
jgi:integrase